MSSHLMSDYDHFSYPIEGTMDNREWLRGDLGVILAYSGWTYDSFAAMLGVTRTTFNSIKNEKGHMSVVQYLAICHLIDKECEDNQALREALNIMNGYGEFDMTRSELVDHYKSAKRKLGTIAGAQKLKDVLTDWMLNGCGTR